MRFHSLTIEGFRSYGDPVTFDLETPGVVLVTGENHDRGVSAEGFTASAASGKSSIFKAITASLFEENDDDSVKDDCINNTRPGGCCIELFFAQDGVEYRVIYARKHAKYGTQWTLFRQSGNLWTPVKGEKNTDTKSIIEKLICMNYSQFVNRSYIPQQQVSDFLNRTYQERVKLFGHILNLTECDTYIRNTLDWKKEVKKTIQESTGKLRVYLNSVEECKKSIQTPQVVQEREKEIEQWNAELDQVQQTLSDCDTQLEALIEYTRVSKDYDVKTKERKSYTFELTNLIVQTSSGDTLATLEEKLKNAGQDVLNEKARLALNKQEIARIKEQINGLNKAGTTCNACQQEVSGEYRQSLSDKLHTDLKIYEQRSEENKQNLIGLERVFAKIQQTEREERKRSNRRGWLTDTIDNLDKQLHDLKVAHDTYIEMGITDDSLANIRQKKTNTQNQQVQLTMLLSNAKHFIQQARNAEQTLTHAQQRYDDQLAFHAEQESLLNRLTACEGIISKFRPYKIEQSREQFNQSLANYIGFLANGDIQAEFVTEVPKADGSGMKPELDILVKDGKKTGVSIKHYSGAEKGGLSLAITGSFHDLACAQSGGDTNILLLDEPFAAQDSWGEEQACKLLERMRDEGRTIFVITNHRHLRESGSFDREIRAVKRNDITTTEFYDLGGQH